MIIIYELKKFFREIANLIFLLVLPIVLMFVLGKTAMTVQTNEFLEAFNIPNDYVALNVKSCIIPNQYQAMDYFGVTMLMMMSFFTCVLGANSYTGEYRMKTINRLLCAKQSRAKTFCQKSIGLVLIAMIENIIFIVVAKLVYQIHFAGSKKEEIAILGMAFLNSVLMIFLGNILGMLLKKNTLMILMSVFTLMMLFGGTFTGNIYIHGLSNRMPIYHLQMAAFRIGSLHRYDLFKSVLTIEGVVLFFSVTIAFLLFYRQDEVR